MRPCHYQMRLVPLLSPIGWCIQSQYYRIEEGEGPPSLIRMGGHRSRAYLLNKNLIEESRIVREWRYDSLAHLFTYWSFLDKEFPSEGGEAYTQPTRGVLASYITKEIDEPETLVGEWEISRPDVSTNPPWHESVSLTLNLCPWKEGSSRLDSL